MHSASFHHIVPLLETNTHGEDQLSLSISSHCFLWALPLYFLLVRFANKLMLRINISAIIYWSPGFIPSVWLKSFILWMETSLIPSYSLMIILPLFKLLNSLSLHSVLRKFMIYLFYRTDSYQLFVFSNYKTNFPICKNDQ